MAAPVMPAREYGSTRDPDHLPARGAERQRGLLVLDRHGGHHLAGDGGDDRQDHDRQDQPGDEVVRAGDVAADERQERERVAEPLLGRLELRDQHEHAPQAVDDRRDGGEQLDQDRQRLLSARGHSSVT
jgi:hypothetical protein